MEKSNSLFLTIAGNVLLIILTVTALFYNEKSLHSILDLEKELAKISLTILQSGDNDTLDHKLKELGEHPLVCFTLSGSPEFLSEQDISNPQERLMIIEEKIRPVLNDFESNFFFINHLLLIMMILYSSALVIYMILNRNSRNYSADLSRLVNSSNRKMETLRTRVSSELHDNVIQNLAAVKLQLSRESDCSSKAGSIQNSIDAIRALIRSLNTLEVQRFNLVEILQEYIRTSNEQSPVPLTLSLGSHESLLNISPEASLHIIRICQEGVSNALRHGEPEYVSIRLSMRDGMIKLNINDNGRGFDPNDRNLKKGIGLISIKERVRELGGTIKIVSRPSEGTELMVQLPPSDENRIKESQ